MHLVKLAPLLLIVLISFSCGLQTHDSKEKNEASRYQGVSFKQDKSNIEVERRALIVNKESSTNEDQNYGVFIGPGLYDVSLAIGALKHLEKQKIKIKLISGNGLGLFIAFLYSHYGSTSLVEWHWYKLLIELEKEKVIYSRNWKNRLFKYYDNNFKNIHFNDLKTVFFVPLYSSAQEKVVNINRGVVRDQLEKAFSFHQPKDGFYSSLTNEVFATNYYKQLGIENIIIIDSMRDEVKMKYGNGYLWGIMTKVIKKIRESKNSGGEYIKLISSTPFQDRSQDAIAIVKEGEIQMKKYFVTRPTKETGIKKL